MGDIQDNGHGDIGRRSVIKKAAAAGVIAWTAPVISGSLASPAAAQTLPSLCFKYQQNWGGTANSPSLVECYNNVTPGPLGLFDQTWTEPCAESHPTLRRAGQATDITPFADRYNSNACKPGKNCCNPGMGADDWWEGNPDGSEVVPTFPNPECVNSVAGTDGALGPCPAVQTGYSNGQLILFTINRTLCPGCYFADGVIAFTTTPGTCPDTVSVSCNQFSSSEFFNTVRFRFDGDTPKFPIYFKFWIACNLNWNQDTAQFVPNSQCDIPFGEPNANPGHMLGLPDGHGLVVIS